MTTEIKAECVTCGEPADKTCKCGAVMCIRHSYFELCAACESARQHEEYGVQLHGRTEAR